MKSTNFRDFLSLIEELAMNSSEILPRTPKTTQINSPNDPPNNMKKPKNKIRENCPKFYLGFCDKNNQLINDHQINPQTI